MIRLLFLFLPLGPLPLLATDYAPPIIINSPDTASTFAFGTIKHRALIWNEAKHMLYAEVTFVDEQQDDLQAEDDTHRFSLPGVAYDKAHGLFFATTTTGETIPVAQRKKTLFLSTIQVLPNAIVRIHHSRGSVSVTLEAIRPADVAREKAQQDQPAPGTNPDGSHTINIQDLLP